MHTDRLGVDIDVGDIVVTVGFSGLTLCKIVRFTTKMVKLHSLETKSRKAKEIPAYTRDVLKVDQQQALIYLLKKDIV